MRLSLHDIIQLCFISYLMITRKKKICRECGREDYIFSKGRCKSCAMKSYSRPGRSDKYQQVKEAEYDAMKLAWDQAADKHGHCHCAECGTVLKEWQPVHCAHVWGKGAAPAFRCDPRNFFMLCFRCHHKFDHGDRKNMKIWPMAITLINKFKHESRETGGRPGYYDGEGGRSDNDTADQE